MKRCCPRIGSLSEGSTEVLANWYKKGPPETGGPLFLQGYSLGKMPWRLQTDNWVAVGGGL